MQIEINKEQMARVFVIRAEGDVVTSVLSTALAEACEALRVISETGNEGGWWYNALDIEIDCPPAADLRKLATEFWDRDWRQMDGSFSKNSFAFWYVLGHVAVEVPKLREAVDAFFAQVAELSKQPKTEGLRSADVFAFGEFEATILAGISRAFVPCYARLIATCDMEHAVWPYDVIASLVEKYGPCPEIDDLIATRLVEAPGHNGFDQFKELHPRIREWYGDPVASPVYAAAERKYLALGLGDVEGLREVFETDWDT